METSIKNLAEHQYFMGLALQEARQASSANEVPVGAVIVDKEQVVAKGHNLVITKCDPSMHAELVAIKKACKKVSNYRLTGFSIYTTLEPCLMCVGAILHSRIATIFYGAPDPKFGGLGSIIDVTQYSWNHRLAVVSGIRSKECATIMQEFFSKKRS